MRKMTKTTAKMMKVQSSQPRRSGRRRADFNLNHCYKPVSCGQFQTGTSMRVYMCLSKIIQAENARSRGKRSQRPCQSQRQPGPDWEHRA